MKRNLILCILLALTVLCLFTFSSCEGGGIHVDTGSETDTDGDIINTDSDTGNTSTDTEGGNTTDTDTEGGNTTDTDTEGGNTTDTDSEGGSGSEDGEGGSGDDNQGGNQGGSGDDNQGGNQGGSGDENQGGNQGGSGDDNQGGGGNEEPPAPTTITDSDGFVYMEEDGALICVGFVRPVDETRVVYMPREYMGMAVVGIKTNAFTDFGIRFGESEYRNASYYYTIAIPTSIKSVEAAAFDLCWGIRICLYTEVQNGDKINYRLLDSSMKNDLSIILDWESNLTLFDRSEKSNKQARDSIWGFRPALGWSRYSAVEIPDFYE